MPSTTPRAPGLVLNRRVLSFASAFLVASLCAFPAPPAAAQGAAPAEAVHFTAGEELARTATLVTGVPISPLLGVSGLGAWRWWRTPAPARAALPWYARPWFWGTGISLALLFALNTTLGALVPGLKKPMDFVEEHENKVSFLVASPIVVAELHRMLGAADLLPDAFADSPAMAAAGLASLSGAGGGALELLVMIGLGAVYLTVFVVVFLGFHAVQVLIALSPSTILDLLLRSFRFSMLVAAAATAAIHPYFGAAYALGIALVCALIAGWSFRLSVYGTVFSWEFLTGRAGAGDPAHERLTAFAGRGLGDIPVRSLGRLESGAGVWSFRWRPWLILPARSLALGSSEGLAIVRGAISPRLVRTGPVRETALARFPPRFRGREERLAARLGAADVLDGRIVRGLRAAWRYLRELVRGGDPADPAIEPELRRAKSSA